MRKLRNVSAIQMALVLFCAMLPTAPAHAQQVLAAIERGYRTGYSDGYVTGYRDSVNHARPDFGTNQEYRRADRAYTADYGSLQDYRDGYQQAFEIGYDDGYQRRGFNSAIPPNLRPRGTINGVTSAGAGASSDSAGGSAGPTVRGAEELIPKDTEFTVELLDAISSDHSQSGDRFQARIIDPAEYEGAVLDGHISALERPGRVKGTARLQLEFDRIRMTDNREGDLKAQVVAVVPMDGSDKGPAVDPEGGVKGKGSKTADAVKVGVGSAVGAIIGAIAGGGRGAAVGGAIGGGAGTAGVMTTRGDEIRLARGQQLKIRTVRESQIQ